ncbi:unnamed protein product [Leuciscus chuanchicus]
MGVIATTMTPVERMCTVVLDEMAIKKQFDYDRRNDAIYGVSGSGAAAKQTMVQAVICDQGSPNVKAVRNLGASLDPLGGEESHCILVGVQRVPVIFDVPHLLKSIRNNLFKYGLQNLFSLIRGKGGHKYNPSAREFTAALRGLSVSNILPALSASAASNCEVDDGTTLLATVSEDAIPSTTTAPMTSLALPTSLTTEIEDEELVLMSDIVEDKTVGDCIEEEGLFYVAGWLVRVPSAGGNNPSLSTLRGRYDLSLPLITCKSCLKSWTPEVKDLILNGYWPGTIEFQTVYTVDLFSTFEDFKVTAPGLSRQAFVRMLQSRSMRSGRVGTISVDCFQRSFLEWTYCRHEMETLLGDDHFSCPACSQDMVAMSLDGNRKMYRFNRNGINENPYFDGTFFAKNEEVAEFLQTIRDKIKTSPGRPICGNSHFKAGSESNKKSQSKLDDEEF